MKKFLLYLFLILALLSALFAYILYTEGAFKTQEPIETIEKSNLEPFMKCEAGKCSTAKCGD